MPTPPRRFRFGLRSLFVLVTVVSVATPWVTYSLNWIRQRDEFIKDKCKSAWQTVDNTAPIGLRLLGEQGVGVLWLPKDASEDDIELGRKLFPEAGIMFGSIADTML